MKVFSYDFGVAGIVHFPLFEVYCNKRTPLHLCILKVFTSCYCGKEVLEKIIWVLEKCLIFSPKILYGPCKRSKLFFSGDYFLTSRDLFHWWCRVSISFGENWCWALLGFKGITYWPQYKHIVILWFLTMEIIIVSPCYNVHVSSINFYSSNTW